MIPFAEFINENSKHVINIETEYMRVYNKLKRENDDKKRDKYLAHLQLIAAQFNEYQFARVVRRL